MKVLILAGGYGTRISEESQYKPKPMIEIGGLPILWHIMKLYSHYGYNDFVILAGYKQYVIKEYFNNYYLHHSDVTFDLANNQMTVHRTDSENWKVTVVDTGLDTGTGGRIKKAKKYINNERFFLTYGDGVSDVQIDKLLDFHLKQKHLVTVTAVPVAQKFGVLEINDNNLITSFREKDSLDSSLINGGFMVCEPECLDYIDSFDQMFEKQPLTKMCSENKVDAYYHNSFWHCMDTKRDKDELENMWNSGKAPWKVW